jgi:RNA polymerase sigma-70 factor (ECF subfamily)
MDLQHALPQSTPAASTDTATDSELVARIRAGEVEVFEIVMRRHNQRLYRIARSILREEDEAMDVVQETYIKAYYQLHQFKGPTGFPSWLSRIASNEAMMRIRKSSRMLYILDDNKNDLNEIKSLEPQPMDKLATQQLRKLIEDAIDLLPIDYRSVYVMRAIQQLSVSETAKSLEVSEEVVKTRYLRAKRSLKRVFEGHIEKAGLNAHEFAGHRCDTIVKTVMGKLQDIQKI